MIPDELPACSFGLGLVPADSRNGELLPFDSFLEAMAITFMLLTMADLTAFELGAIMAS